MTTVESGGMEAARISLAIGAVLGALGLAVIVYGLNSSMVRRFDMTVRALAGMK
jgi:hypothetical protein